MCTYDTEFFLSINSLSCTCWYFFHRPNTHVDQLDLQSIPKVCVFPCWQMDRICLRPWCVDLSNPLSCLSQAHISALLSNKISLTTAQSPALLFGFRHCNTLIKNALAECIMLCMAILLSLHANNSCPLFLFVCYYLDDEQSLHGPCVPSDTALILYALPT